ncbi:phytanoyl-CoA dioxygenase family protein [Novosphingobium sp. G106]|uniref:phytanoyl-CoA dioxygenase family protein n=1 Tax=Novosphingobium sp. G106 TaxID=2849500 RepID=UPI001C2D1CAE|nr:phytanoyl-CoA dioxygenase family protein [Novosphingobium sp. G106]MBV1687111.1 phytanoyl-CoA dioxygenase family protein [Novosphingobium sp. G106]
MTHLADDQVEAFITDGFVRIDNTFPAELAAEARTILWRDMELDPADSAGWTRPVVRLGHYAQAPFRVAANTPPLHAAFDRLVGPGGWQPPAALGTFVVRFPSPEPPGDDGWHVDASFGADNPDFMEWRLNVASRGRALLMLFLFSDIDELDAPTRLRVGSHIDIARRLAPAGDEGLSLRDLAEDDFAGSAKRPEALATGKAGTVYLCHPFLVHAGQPNRNGQPRFLAQPPLLPTLPMALERQDGSHVPVETAIRRAIGRD